MISYFVHLRDPLEEDISFNFLRSSCYNSFNLFEKNRFKYLKTIKEISSEFILSNKDSLDVYLTNNDKIFVEKVYFVDMKYKTSILFKYIFRTKHIILLDKIIIPSINKIYEILEINKEVESIHNKYLNELNISILDQDMLKYFADPYMTINERNEFCLLYNFLLSLKEIPLNLAYFDYVNSINDFWDRERFKQEVIKRTYPGYWDDKKSSFDYSNTEEKMIERSFEKIHKNLHENIIMDPEIESVLNRKYKNVDKILFELSQNEKYNNLFINRLNLNRSSEILSDYLNADTFNNFLDYIIDKGIKSIYTDFSLKSNFIDNTIIREINRYDLSPIKTYKLDSLNLNHFNSDLINGRIAKMFSDIIAFDVNINLDEGINSNINTILDLHTCSLFSNSLIPKEEG